VPDGPFWGGLPLGGRSRNVRATPWSTANLPPVRVRQHLIFLQAGGTGIGGLSVGDGPLGAWERSPPASAATRGRCARIFGRRKFRLEIFAFRPTIDLPSLTFTRGAGPSRCRFHSRGAGLHPVFATSSTFRQKVLAEF
jgi:hypothetical protein